MSRWFADLRRRSTAFYAPRWTRWSSATCWCRVPEGTLDCAAALVIRGEVTPRSLGLEIGKRPAAHAHIFAAQEVR